LNHIRTIRPGGKTRRAVNELSKDYARVIESKADQALNAVITKSFGGTQDTGSGGSAAARPRPRPDKANQSKSARKGLDEKNMNRAPACRHPSHMAIGTFFSKHPFPAEQILLRVMPECSASVLELQISLLRARFTQPRPRLSPVLWASTSLFESRQKLSPGRIPKYPDPVR